MAGEREHPASGIEAGQFLLVCEVNGVAFYLMRAVPPMNKRQFLVAAGTRDDATDLSLVGCGGAAASCASSFRAVWGQLLPPLALLVKPAGSKECAINPLFAIPHEKPADPARLSISAASLFSRSR
jgi:hypothetical protein